MTKYSNFNTEEVHDRAMLISQDAFVLVAYGKEEEAIPLYQQAFELEREAALSLLGRDDLEPTRSVLFRSAAALAKKCHRYRDAEQMIGFGLSGNPPEDVAEELRELFDIVRKLQQPKKLHKVSKQKAALNA